MACASGKQEASCADGRKALVLPPAGCGTLGKLSPACISGPPQHTWKDLMRPSRQRYDVKYEACL